MYTFPNPTSKVGQLIKRRRLQMLVHSCAYYEMDNNLIDDDTWQLWANELADLLKKHPNEYSDRFDEYFKGWDGTTGHHLPLRDSWVMSATLRLYHSKEIYENQ